MAIPTWKVLTSITIGLIAFAVYAAVADVSLGPINTLVTIGLALLLAALFYVMLRVGLKLGKQIGSDEK